MILEKNAESLDNTEAQILTRPVPATTFKALGVNPGVFVLLNFVGISICGIILVSQYSSANPDLPNI